MRSFSKEPGDLTSAEARAHPLAFYRQFFAGWTPEDLSAHAPIVYERLRRKGQLRLIPGKTPPPFGGDPLAYYREHCPGMTRQQAALAEPQFYSYLQRYGLLGTIPFAPAKAAGEADARQREMLPERSPSRQRSDPTEQPRRRLPSLSSARLECFRIIPE